MRVYVCDAFSAYSFLFLHSFFLPYGVFLFKIQRSFPHFKIRYFQNMLAHFLNVDSYIHFPLQLFIHKISDAVMGMEDVCMKV